MNKNLVLIGLLVVLSLVVMGCTPVPEPEYTEEKWVSPFERDINHIVLCEKLAEEELGYTTPDCEYSVLYKDSICDCQELATGKVCLEYRETENTKMCINRSDRTIPERGDHFEIK